MSTKIDLDADFLRKLNALGWSYQQLADRFKVSLSTIKRLFRTNVSNPEVLAFTRKLEALIADVPTEHCRKELLRTIHQMRSHQASSREAKEQKIIESLHTGACEIEDIVDDCFSPKAEIFDEVTELLEGMIADGTVERRERGGVLNRGAGMKYHYRLAKDFVYVPMQTATDATAHV